VEQLQIAKFGEHNKPTYPKSTVNINKTIPSHIISKLLKTSHKKKVLKAARENMHNVQEYKNKVYGHFSLE
jgi:hypothetical protein